MRLRRAWSVGDHLSGAPTWPSGSGFASPTGPVHPPNASSTVRTPLRDRCRRPWPASHEPASRSSQASDSLRRGSVSLRSGSRSNVQRRANRRVPRGTCARQRLRGPASCRRKKLIQSRSKLFGVGVADLERFDVVSEVREHARDVLRSHAHAKGRGVGRRRLPD